MQGVYRVRRGSGETLESFVAAGGPMGWRYFGRISDPGTQRETGAVDLVVDLDWRLVRYRAADAEGAEVVAVPGPDGVEVALREGGSERVEVVPGAREVWSSSPAALLVLDRLARTAGQAEFLAARVEPRAEPEAVNVRLGPREAGRVETAGGAASAVERVRVAVDGRSLGVLVRSDLPLSADGWFELIA